MQVRVEDKEVRVVLSKRNLDDLLAQYEKYGFGELSRRDADQQLQLFVETDEIHYRDREPGTGWLHHPLGGGVE